LRRSVEQLHGHCRVKRAEAALRQPGVGENRRVTIADGSQQDDRVGFQAACDEGEHVGCRAIEPVGVLGDQNQRRVAGDFRQQVERRHGDAGCPLSWDQVSRVVLDRPQQLMQAREGKTRLRLNAGRTPGSPRSTSAARPSSGARSFDRTSIERASSHPTNGESIDPAAGLCPALQCERGAYFRLRLGGRRNGRRHLDRRADQLGGRGRLRQGDRVRGFYLMRAGSLGRVRGRGSRPSRD
jgi:hypothetical protein